MRLVAVTFFVILSVAIAEQDFSDHVLFVKTADADAAHSRIQRAAAPASPADVVVQNIPGWTQRMHQQDVRKTRQQPDSNANLSPYSTQRSPEKPRPFQPVTSSQQNASFPIQKPSSLSTLSNISYLASKQSSSMSYSTPKPNYPSDQKPSSSFISQSFSGSTSYNPRPIQPLYSNTGLTAFPPLNHPDSSTTYLSSRPPFFSSTTPRPSVPSSIQTGNIDLEGAYSAHAEAALSIPGNQLPSKNILPPIGSSTPATSPRLPFPIGGPSGYRYERPSTYLPHDTTKYIPHITKHHTYIPPSTTKHYIPHTTEYYIPTTTHYIPTTTHYIPHITKHHKYIPPSTTTHYISHTTTHHKYIPPTTTTHYIPSISYNYSIIDSRGYLIKKPSSTLGYPSSTPPPIIEPPRSNNGKYIIEPPYPINGKIIIEPPRLNDTTTESTVPYKNGEEIIHTHIHKFDVVCSETMMTINIEFNRVFNGIIYSKGYYSNPQCIYVKQNSGRKQYSFTVNSCGTRFIEDFEGKAGQGYLENVLVLQNEPDVQEIWDMMRRVRCLWEGNINKTLKVDLLVDMLRQDIVTFSGDTVAAKLDIQMGKGPFAPTANGIVKIGETMTLVVSVEGDADFDLQVRDCVARGGEASTNMLQLTDERGCILKPKLFGAFQKTRNTKKIGTSIIAYAFFQAFRFPDVMDLFIECKIELCKTHCEPCPKTNQQMEPGRHRRSVTYVPPSNTTTNPVLLSDPVRIGRRFKVIMLDDLSTESSQILEGMEETAVEAITNAKDICMSNSGFYTVFFLMLSTIFIAIISAAMLYIKLQRLRRSKFVDS